MPSAHKIGAAISGPRITGGNFMDTTLFLIVGPIKSTKTPLQNCFFRRSVWRNPPQVSAEAFFGRQISEPAVQRSFRSEVTNTQLNFFRVGLSFREGCVHRLCWRVLVPFRVSLTFFSIFLESKGKPPK